MENGEFGLRFFMWRLEIWTGLTRWTGLTVGMGFRRLDTNFTNTEKKQGEYFFSPQIQGDADDKEGMRVAVSKFE
jgi:hypothetical protein